MACLRATNWKKIPPVLTGITTFPPLVYKRLHTPGHISSNWGGSFSNCWFETNCKQLSLSRGNTQVCFHRRNSRFHQRIPLLDTFRGTIKALMPLHTDFKGFIPPAFIFSSVALVLVLSQPRPSFCSITKLKWHFGLINCTSKGIQCDTFEQWNLSPWRLRCWQGKRYLFYSWPSSAFMVARLL